jgi:iron(III) transport system substrate-binding protein
LQVNIKLPMNRLILFLLASLIMTSCRTASDEVNVYTDRHYESDEILFKKFTEKTGIRVNVVKADSDQLIKRLELEGENTPADMFISSDAGRLNLAREKGLLQPASSEFITENVPSELRDSENYWTGLTKRTRIIVYHTERVNPEQLSTYEALAEQVWKGKILCRSSQSTYNQSLLASIVAYDGYDSAKTWADAINKNFAQEPKGNDRDQVKAIAAGIGDIALINSYYLGLLMNSSNEEERNVSNNVGVFFPNQDGRGAHVNISGMSVVKSARNKENSIKLMEFMLNHESQKLLTDSNHEYPVVEGVEWSDLLRSWGTFKADLNGVSKLGKYQGEAVKIFNLVGWK